MNLSQLPRAILRQKQLIHTTAENAEACEQRAEALPPGERTALNATAALLRSKLPGLISELHTLEAALPTERGIRVVTLECQLAQASGSDGRFSHEVTPCVPVEMTHHWEGFTAALNSAAA